MYRASPLPDNVRKLVHLPDRRIVPVERTLTKWDESPLRPATANSSLVALPAVLNTQQKYVEPKHNIPACACLLLEVG